ncbi:MAG: hypothetical protein KAX05_16605, partial [Bacteroidales bacterium]|nr:hypothetical protein [Bacteroidales bacterium]
MKSVSRFQKNCIRIALTAVLVSFFSLQSLAQLSGTKTIDQSGAGDYISFTAAVNALIAQGVNGAVIFDVVDEDYNEQINIPVIQGASETNTITFQGNETDSTLVRLYYSAGSSSNNYVVFLDGVSHIVFRKMTLQATGTSYARVILLDNSADSLKIENCRLLGLSTTSTSSNVAIIYSYNDKHDDMIIQNNLIKDGSFGIDIDKTSSYTSSNVQILNNTFWNQAQYAIKIDYEDKMS